MRVRLTVNIGHNDARRLGLTALREGSVVDVPDNVGDELLSRGWAGGGEVPDTLEAVPDLSLKTRRKAINAPA
jgi:hypothetical protein